MFKEIITQSGNTRYRHECKKIHHGLYVKDEECFEIDGKWYRKDSSEIIFDHQKQKWILKSKAGIMKQGIVDFEKNAPVLGYFTPSLTQNVRVLDMLTGRESVCINADTALKACVEDVSTGKYLFNASMGGRANAAQIRNAVDNKVKGYNIEDNIDEMQQKIASYNSYQTPVKRDVAMFSTLLGDITFGAEVECIRGYLPDHLQHQTGVVVCRDGSLHDADGTQGPEFTTIPLQGAKGVQTLIDLGNHLSDRTIVDKHCSFHLHLGNIPTTRAFLVSMYKLAFMIQNEIFEMFPFYKNDERRWAGKDKNYCKKLQRLSMFALKNFEKESYKYYVNDNYTRLFTFLASGEVPCKQWNRKLGIHPKAGEKWNKNARYHWVNFLNTIFSKRNTVEFRIHTGTTNPQKMVSWLFICNAIVKTAMCRQADILQGKKITLNEVLDYYGNTFKNTAGLSMSKYLKEYVGFRKVYFRNDFERNDYISNRELTEDRKFSYIFTGISEMFNK